MRVQVYRQDHIKSHGESMYHKKHQRAEVQDSLIGNLLHLFPPSVPQLLGSQGPRFLNPGTFAMSLGCSWVNFVHLPCFLHEAVHSPTLSESQGGTPEPQISCLNPTSRIPILRSFSVTRRTPRPQTQTSIGLALRLDVYTLDPNFDSVLVPPMRSGGLCYGPS
mmetsp:Transcript_3470/g.5529  ORF Transcript_3470/g.5529 Transcript_3470/m.5529 type:complete len:164 (+) Transcript_3470:157-648(+)